MRARAMNVNAAACRGSSTVGLAVLVLRPGWRHHEPPIHWIAGVDSPRHLASAFTAAGLLAG
jgi:hypothetical protein